MRLGAPVVILLAACAPRVSTGGYAPADVRGAGCFLMLERHDTPSTSAFRAPAWRVLLEQYAQGNARMGKIWFYSDSVPPRRVMWGGWLRGTADTLELGSGTYPTAHYGLRPDARGGFSGRGVMTSDAGTNGRFPTFTWAVQLERVNCAVLTQ